jgi:tetratricopeptide (TPR) repeat protein
VRYHAVGPWCRTFLASHDSQKMKGTLTAQPLVELIREISGKGLTGTLRLEHERVQVAVYFDNGEIIFAASNVKSLRLKEYLIKRGLLAEKDFETLGRNVSDVALGAALTAAGIVKERDISNLLKQLVSDVLRVALLWTEGTWEFNERARLADKVQVSVDVAGLLAAAALRLPAEFVSGRWKNLNENISRGSGISKTSSLLPAESFILSRLDAPMTVNDLIAQSGLPEVDALRTMYGLALRGLVEREHWQNAFRSDPAKAAAAGDGSKAADGWAKASSENEELLAFLARQKDATNHYEVLELEPSASSSEIKKAYYAMARRYHPDRFHLKSGTQLHSDISTVFANITRVYETLANPHARADYDKTLVRAQKVAETKRRDDAAKDILVKDEDVNEAVRAEACFKQGSAALGQGQSETAARYLAAAVRADPQNATYHAYYGKSLAANQKTRRLAESELQTAIKIEPNNSLFRVMLAELYFELRFYRRAQSELEKVLATDPRNGPANVLLQKLENSSKVG